MNDNDPAKAPVYKNEDFHPTEKDFQEFERKFPPAPKPTNQVCTAAPLSVGMAANPLAALGLENPLDAIFFDAIKKQTGEGRAPKNGDTIRMDTPEGVMFVMYKDGGWKKAQGKPCPHCGGFVEA